MLGPKWTPRSSIPRSGCGTVMVARRERPSVSSASPTNARAARERLSCCAAGIAQVPAHGRPRGRRRRAGRGGRSSTSTGRVAAGRQGDRGRVLRGARRDGDGRRRRERRAGAAAADVGIAMGVAGTDAALETADVALMADELLKIPYAMRLSRATTRNIRVNIGVLARAEGGVPRSGRRRRRDAVDGGARPTWARRWSVERANRAAVC